MTVINSLLNQTHNNFILAKSIIVFLAKGILQFNHTQQTSKLGEELLISFPSLDFSFPYTQQ
jgi:hexokinase